MNNFEQAYGKIEKEVVEKTNGLMNRLVKINEELRDLNIPIRVFSKTTKELNKFSKENQLYFKHTVNHAINFASDF